MEGASNSPYWFHRRPVEHPYFFLQATVGAHGHPAPEPVQASPESPHACAWPAPKAVIPNRAACSRRSHREAVGTRRREESAVAVLADSVLPPDSSTRQRTSRSVSSVVPSKLRQARPSHTPTRLRLTGKSPERRTPCSATVVPLTVISNFAHCTCGGFELPWISMPAAHQKIPVAADFRSRRSTAIQHRSLPEIFHSL